MVIVNGTPLAARADLGVTAGWRAASLPFRLDVPPALLRPGKNLIAVSAGTSDAPRLPEDALITTVRLDLRMTSPAVPR